MNKDSKKQFGLFATIAIIISGVIGSGIFFKADRVMNLTHSAYLTMFAWVVLGIMTLLVSIAFFEVQSTTASRDGKTEIGSISNWSKKFVGKKFGTWVGIFSVYFYLPASIFAFLILGSEYVLNIFWDTESTANASFSDQWTYVAALIILVAAFASFFLVINAKSFGFSKNFQMIGTIVKMLPIVILIIVIPLELAFGIFGDAAYNGNWDQIGEISSITNPDTGTSEVVKEEASYIGFFAAFPLVLFTLHGFVWGGTLQNETKTPSTFKKALLVSTIVVIFAYLGLNAVMLSVGTESEYGIIAVFSVVFDSPIVQDTMTLFIIVSILSATNAMFMYMARNINEMAKDKMLDDKKGYSLVTEKGTYSNALKHAGLVIAIYFAAFIVMDLVLFPWSQDVAIEDFGNVMMGFSDIYIMLDFLIYAVILVYAIKNRRTNHVKVEKQKSFMGTAYISSIMTFGVVALYFVSMFVTYISSAGITTSDIVSTVSPDNNTYGSYYAPILALIALCFSSVFYKKIHARMSKVWSSEDLLFELKDNQYFKDLTSEPKSAKAKQTLNPDLENEVDKVKTKSKATKSIHKDE